MDRQDISSRSRKRQKHLKEKPKSSTGPIQVGWELTDEGTRRPRADIQKYVDDHRPSLEILLKDCHSVFIDVEKKKIYTPHTPHYYLGASDTKTITLVSGINPRIEELQNNDPPKEVKENLDELKLPRSIVSTFRGSKETDVDKMPAFTRLARLVAYPEKVPYIATASDENRESLSAENGVPQSNPSTQHKGPDNGAKLSPRAIKAYQSYKTAKEKNPDLESERDVHKYLKEYIDLDYKLPKLPAWQRYLRLWRNHCNSQKNTPRNDRPLFRSIVPQDRI